MSQQQPRITHSLDMEYVWVAPGSFLMGSPLDEPERFENETPHWVTLTHSYDLQTTPVTQAQWQAVMGRTVAQQRDRADPDWPLRAIGPEHPIYYVSWHDCQEFLQRLNARGEGVYRLPTEAEWEYACRAGTHTPFAIGNGRDLDSTQANFHGDYPYGQGQKGLNRAATTPVKSFAPNAWGLYDMHGNVWEWCQDWFGAYPAQALSDPQGPEQGRHRVLRGGSWYGSARFCRSASRDALVPDGQHYYVGFRLLRLP